MNFSKEHIDELIGKYLCGEGTPEEAIFLDEWRQQSLENERHFTHSEKLFRVLKGESNVLFFNADQAWEHVRSQIAEQKSSGRIIPIKSFPWRAAASIAILIAIGVAVLFLLQPSNIEGTITSTDHIITDTLPQGDIVHLNRQSSIQYVYDPKQNSAKIALEGEAFFDLRNPKQTTVVHNGSLMIRDIGTKFNVRAQAHLDTVLVTVQEGEVKLYTQKNDGISVKAGESGYYIRSARTFEKTTSFSLNDLSWKTRNFHFNNATLLEVANTLNAAFETRFIIEQPVEHCRITVQFYNEQPAQIAEIIAETLGLEWVMEENKITLKGSGCAQ